MKTNRRAADHHRGLSLHKADVDADTASDFSATNALPQTLGEHPSLALPHINGKFIVHAPFNSPLTFQVADESARPESDPC